MRKIPTLFKRDPEDMRHVTDEVHPECQWVLDGEGVATRKYDGTCVMFDGERWWARREVKPGKILPPGYVAIDTDPVTRKIVGWEPIEQSSFAKFHAEAVGGADAPVFASGTYELCGPKINGNPEGYDSHELIRHADAQTITQTLFDFGPDSPPDAVDFAEALRLLGEQGWEGVVWHHPDGRMAKLKVRDLR